MQIRRINYSSKKQITAQKIQLNGNYIWMGYAKNSSNICLLEKKYIFDPQQTFFSLSKQVDKIVKFDVDNTNLYIAYEDDSLLGEIVSLTNPLTTTTEILIPEEINEFPVDIKVKDSKLFYLIPGVISGTITTLLRYNLSGVLQQTIELDKSGLQVNNAFSFVIDNNSDIWIVTKESPSRLIRVFDLGEFNYDFESTEIII